MASITASWKNAASRLLAAAFCLWLCCGGAAAAEVEISNPQLLAVEDGYVLNAEFTIDFGPRLEEAVDKGLVLNFVVEFALATVLLKRAKGGPSATRGALGSEARLS